MKTIWKFKLNSEGRPVLMPQEARPLHVAFQGHDLCLWAEVDRDGLPMQARRFAVRPTGEVFPSGGTYIGTAFTGPFVFHVYETQ